MKKFVLLITLMLVRFSLFSQVDFSTNLQQAFTSYQEQAIQEKLFAHTDKTFYVAGEIIWFKLYLVDGTFHKPLRLSNVAYVEVISTDQKPVLQAKIEMQDGAGTGSFMLPFSLNSGTYLFRVYTAWMKNFGSEHFFQKPITIVNTLKRPDWKKIEVPVMYDVQFFPEGGNLVYGLQSKVAFKAVNQHGRGVRCTGVLTNGTNDTIAHFQSFKFGMGHFNLTPVNGAKYKAIVKFEDGVTVIKELPSVYTQGYVMTTTDLDSDHIGVSVATANVADAAVYLSVHTGQINHGVLKKALTDGKTKFILDKKGFREGISHITLFSETGDPLCERVYFKRPERQLDIQIKADQSTYGVRKKVTLNVQAQLADLSLSVFLLDSLQTTEAANIQTYLWLTSDLKGFIESPDYYFEPGNDAAIALDNLLLTQGWRRFRWEDVVKNEKPSFPFPPEYEGPIVSGKVVHAITGTAGSNIKAYLSIPGGQFNFSTTTSNDTGGVHFVIPKRHGNAAVIARPADSTYRIEIANPFSEQYGTTPLPEFTVSQNEEQALQARSVYTQTQHAFFREQQEHFYAPAWNDTTAFYGKPDKTYFLDDYTRFTTIEEVMREYIAEVRVRKSADGFHYQVQNIPYKTFFEKDPLLLLDGVPVSDLNRFMAFDPLKIKKLEVVARKYFFNDLVADGIVSYTTYNQDLAGFELPANARILDYDGTQLKREFYAPVYEVTEQIESRLPDFRNLLAWLPDVKTDSTGKIQCSFYTSDLPGRYAIVIQGIDKTGMAGSSIVTFFVQK